ncbi:hypothetical protein MA16_Dca024485 [Dendrobium catenatum]|uniref:Uncharacterized protein n=1 Tax=Dendrobium catenatum TaxID=906689 RepID=A0A2I0VA09_9ASPA|nr:hypothetical protein MA16_Dca024485 [Dendrobium catenatum]
MSHDAVDVDSSAPARVEPVAASSPLRISFPMGPYIDALCQTLSDDDLLTEESDEDIPVHRVCVVTRRGTSDEQHEQYDDLEEQGEADVPSTSAQGGPPRSVDTDVTVLQLQTQMAEMARAMAAMTAQSESFVRPRGRSRAIPPCAVSEGSSGRAGGSSLVARRQPSGNQREPSSSVAPALVHPSVYILNQQEARDAPDMVIGIYILPYCSYLEEMNDDAEKLLSSHLALASFFLPVFCISLSCRKLEEFITLLLCYLYWASVHKGLKRSISGIDSMIGEELIEEFRVEWESQGQNKTPTARRRSPYKITSTFPGAADSPGPLTPKRSTSLVNFPRDKP